MGERRLKTGEGIILFCVSQIACSEEPYKSEIRQHLKGLTEKLEHLTNELLPRGFWVREIEDASRSRLGGC